MVSSIRRVTHGEYDGDLVKYYGSKSGAILAYVFARIYVYVHVYVCDGGCVPLVLNSRLALRLLLGNVNQWSTNTVGNACGAYLPRPRLCDEDNNQNEHQHGEDQQECPFDVVAPLLVLDGLGGFREALGRHLQLVGLVLHVGDLLIALERHDHVVPHDHHGVIDLLLH